MDQSNPAEILDGDAQSQLRSIVDRVERLDSEKAEISEQTKEVIAEAKANGFAPKIIRKIVRMRKLSRAARQEEEALTDLYLHAVEGV